MKWFGPLLKLLGGLKEVFIAFFAFTFGYKRGADAVAAKVEKAQFEIRKSKRAKAKKVLSKWARIRDGSNVIQLPRKKD